MRIQAISALELFQESQDVQCPVTTAFIELLRKDSSPEVRRCVLNKIGVSDRTLPSEFYSLIRFGSFDNMYVCSKNS